MDIIKKQALRLVTERWFDIPTAVAMAIAKQQEKWFANDKWELNYRWKEYSKLTPEKREEVRKKIQSWAEWKDFTFYKWEAIFIPDLK